MEVVIILQLNHLTHCLQQSRCEDSGYNKRDMKVKNIMENIFYWK